MKFMEKSSIRPDEVNSSLENLGTPVIKQSVKLKSLITRPQVAMEDLVGCSGPLKDKVEGITGDREDIVYQAEIFCGGQGWKRNEGKTEIGESS